MLGHDHDELNRRGFLRTGAVATAAVAALGQANAADDADAKAAVPIPKRPLGKTGIDVSILNLGTWRSSGLDRLLRFAWANGIRYVDAAKSYGSEPGIGKWLQANPEVRKDLFLVTKDHPNTPKQLIEQLAVRLDALKTDYVDLLFIHAMGVGYPADSVEWPKSKEFKETIEAIKKSGKAKLVGFSCHDVKIAEYLNSAAEGGFVDAIMVKNTAWLPKDTPFNKALDACHKRGIGLISMKQIAAPDPEPFLKEVPKHAPELIEKGLKPYQALLHAIWTDERFASCCVSMRNTNQITENSVAARKYEPLKQAELDGLRKAFLASRPTMCPDCDGRCAVAAGTNAALGDLTRFLTYHERHGYRTEARRLYAELSSDAKNWKDADLEAARKACHNELDFASLLPRVERNLA